MSHSSTPWYNSINNNKTESTFINPNRLFPFFEGHFGMCKLILSYKINGKVVLALNGTIVKRF